jgi:glycosyltransferase involved in cell wall biosynthesis
MLVRQLDDLGHHGIEARLEKIVHRHHVVAIHALADAHISFAAAHRVARRAGTRFVLSVHDAPWYKRLRFQAGNRNYFEALACAWRDADACTVISDEMGAVLCARYGTRKFEVVTHGVEPLPAQSGGQIDRSFTMYFCGSIHLAHRNNFHLFIEAMELVRARTRWLPTMIIRGSAWPSTASDQFVASRPWGASDDEVMIEAESADILYLPVPFGKQFAHFATLSLPTKLVTYLGSGRPILYHGPETSAPARLLRESGAAFMLHEQNPARIADAVVRWIESDHPAACAERARNLANTRFTREHQQRVFWSAVLGGERP